MSAIKQAVLAAEKRIRSYIRETPLDFSRQLSKETGATVYLKCENLQYTNSFKLRGALSKLLSLTPAQQKIGIVTASSGNHGAAIAYGLNLLKIPGIIFVPENAASTKVDNIRQYHPDLAFYGNDTGVTEMHALEHAKAHDLIYISPYNDMEVIGGQGTIALALVKQLQRIDAIFIPVGGGGLISGIAGYIKAVSPHTKIIGCSPINSPVMAESVKAGHIVEMPSLPTLSDGTAGGLEPDTITFDFCKNLVDEFVLVSEDEIKAALILLIKNHHLLLEGAAGVALAALMKNTKSYQGKNVVVVLSGGNISLDTLKRVLA